jgi:hypothetical protein
VTGLGTPNAANLLPDLGKAGAADEVAAPRH